MRVSGTDWAEGGWDVEQTVAFAQALEARGCGGDPRLERRADAGAEDPGGPSYQVPLARAVKAATGCRCRRWPDHRFEQAEAIVGTGDADLVALARAILYDPRWPWHAAAHLGAQVKGPEAVPALAAAPVPGALERAGR